MQGGLALSASLRLIFLNSGFVTNLGFVGALPGTDLRDMNETSTLSLAIKQLA